MKPQLKRFLCTLCALALLLPPAAALAEGEQESVQLRIGSNPQASFIVPGAGLDTENLYLNGIPYTPGGLNQKGNIIMRTGDLMAAEVIGEITKVEPGAYQIKDGKVTFKISVNVPDEGEAAPPPAAATETNPLALFQYVEDRTSDERLSYPEDVIKQYAQALIDGVANLIEMLESEKVLKEFRNSDGSFSVNLVQDADIPALLTYVTSMLSGDPVTAEAFDNAMYAIYSKLCLLDDQAGNQSGNYSANTARLFIHSSALMVTLRTVMRESGMNLPGYINWGNYFADGAETKRGPWRESDYGKLDELSTVQTTLGNATAFQLKGGIFELSDGAGNKQPLVINNVWHSPIVKDADPAPAQVDAEAPPVEEIDPEVPDPEIPD